MTKTPTSRLDKLLANMGYASRREIQLLAKNGRIRLDGTPLPRADERIAGIRVTRKVRGQRFGGLTSSAHKVK